MEYCLITIAPDFILCVLATAFSLKLRPVFLGMMHEYSMVRKVVYMAYFPMFVNLKDQPMPGGSAGRDGGLRKVKCTSGF